jgi:outer membrane protein assembly factor BamD (BamD/ComL family)
VLIMRITNYLLMLLAVGGCLSATDSYAKKKEAAETVYVVEEKGRSTWRVMFDKKMPIPAEQWEYARKTQNKGYLKKADRRMLYLVRRWPNSREAPWAARARADMFFARGKLKKAFTAYQFLIDNYSSRMRDYDAVLENQYKVAGHVMNRKRMRWFFGGYRAPEYAVDYFETVIRNGPQWEVAPEAQYMIGRCYQEAEELELAITSFGVLGYRYPDSRFGEESAWEQIRCYEALHKKYPNNGETIDRTLTATTVFLTTYSASKHKSDVIQLRNTLYETKAGRVFAEAQFYAKVPKQPKAAILYYESMIEEFPKSKKIPKAEERIEDLEFLMSLPAQASGPRSPRSRPLFGRGSGHADG